MIRAKPPLAIIRRRGFRIGAVKDGAYDRRRLRTTATD
jgi:hypothetical protein